MNRTIVYPGSIPQDTDILTPQRAAMVAIGYALQAVFGTNPVASGLAATPVAGGLTLTVGPGSLTTYTVVDATAYGSLGTNGDPLLKIGVNAASTLLTFTAPTTPGQSTNFLVQASLLEQDVNLTVLPFYNAADPSVPLSGPGGTGASLATARTQSVSIQVKAGAPANAGSQVTPGADAGWVPLYVVTVNAGASSLNSDNVQLYPTAPFLPTLLPNMRKRVFTPLNLYVSNSGSDANIGTTAMTPFATVQAAINYAAAAYDLQGEAVIINLAAGTYLGFYVFGTLIDSQVNIVGDVADPAAVVIAQGDGNCVSAGTGAILNLSGVTLQCQGAGSCAINASNSAIVTIGAGVVIGSCGYAQVVASYGAIVGVSAGGFTLAGVTEYGIVSTDATVVFSNSTFVLSGGPTYSGCFCAVTSCGSIDISGCAFTGGATGTQYVANTNGVLLLGNLSGSYLPGSAAGSTSTGGQVA